MLCLCCLPVFQLSQPSFIGALYQAEIRAKRQHVIIRSLSNLGKTPSINEYDVDLDRDGHRLVLKASSSGHQRLYFLKDQEALVYDSGLGQYIARRFSRPTALDQMLSALGLSPEPFYLLAINPDAANRSFLDGLRALAGASLHKGNGVAILQNPNVRVACSASTSMPTEISFTGRGRNVSTTFHYLAHSGDVSFSPPATARYVSAFAKTAVPPKFESASAKAISEACRQAYSNLRSLVFQVHTGQDSSNIYWSGEKARQEDRLAIWAFNGSQLFVIDKAHRRYYAARASQRDLPDRLSKLGLYVDPTLRLLMAGENLMDALYSPIFKARKAGELTLGGVQLDLLELRSGGARIQVQIRRSDHLIGGFLTENLDPADHVISHSERQFRYVYVNKPISNVAFELAKPAGFSSERW